MFESLATAHSRRVHFGRNSNKDGKVVDEERDGEHAGHVHFHTHATHGHAHGGSLAVANGDDKVEDLSKLELIKHRITAKVISFLSKFNFYLIALS